MSRQNRARRASGPQPSRGRRLSWGVVIAALVVFAAAGIAVVATSGTLPPGGAAASPSVSAPAVVGGALPTYGGPGADPAIGMAAPIIEGRSFAGQSVSVTADGRPKLILFLAHWCPHCQREVPVVQSWLAQKGAPAGVDLVSIVTSIDPGQPNYPPDAWLEREGWTVPVIVDDDGRIAAAYGLSAFPFWVALDSSGRVERRLTGELPEASLDDLVARLAGDAP